MNMSGVFMKNWNAFLDWWIESKDLIIQIKLIKEKTLFDF